MNSSMKNDFEKKSVDGFVFTLALIPCPVTRSLPLARPSRASAFGGFLSPLPKRLKSPEERGKFCRAPGKIDSVELNPAMENVRMNLGRSNTQHRTSNIQCDFSRHEPCSRGAECEVAFPLTPALSPGERVKLGRVPEKFEGVALNPATGALGILKRVIILIAIAAAGIVDVQAQQASLKLWYRQPPGADWNAALPVGNGRLGAMVFGNVERERLQLNEDSVWEG